MKENFGEVSVMKRIISLLIAVITLVICIQSVTFAEEDLENLWVYSNVVSTVSPASKVYIPYKNVEIAICKRIIDNYKKGIKTTVIGLQGVGDTIDLPSEILFDAASLSVESKEIINDGDKLKITVTVDIHPSLKNSKELDEELDKIIAEANQYSSIREKLAYINDKIAATTTYGGTDVNRYSTAEGVFIDKTAVCSGYSDAVHEICDRLGVPWTYIYGYKHRSTMVYIDGQWHAWDLTWNCVGPKRINREVIVAVIKNEGGEPTIITDLAKRQYFLLPLGSDRFNEYIKEMKADARCLGKNEMVLSILHPDMATIDLSLDKWEIDPNTIKDPKNDSSPIYGGHTNYSDKKPIMAKPTSSTVYVNGRKIDFDAYNINGNNYFKLRDLAMAIRGTEKQFEVEWDGKNNAIKLTTGKPYTPVGGELQPIKEDEEYIIDSKGNLTVIKKKSDKVAIPTTSKIYLNGKEVEFTAYKIDGNNYFKLRDVGKAINFGVEYDSKTKAITINTKTTYKE